MHSQQLLHEIEILPPELQKQVSDFVVFLRRQQQKQQIKKRTVGEYADKISIMILGGDAEYCFYD